MNPQNPQPSPLISLVVPVFNMTRYLPAFLESLDRQDLDPATVEVIFVDDGSTDGSGELCETFIRGRRNIRVLRKANGGLASARNHGLAAATGRWVSFPDPDDVLESGYLNEIVAAMREWQSSPPDLFAASLIYLDDRQEGTRSDTHPLRWKFRYGNRILSLDSEPESLQFHANSAFLRVDRLREHALLFDERIRPTFEDSHLIARYLLRSPQPRLGVVATAKYLYRKRNDGSSLVDTSAAVPEKYTTVLEWGYLALLDEAEELTGGIPEWVSATVLYDLGWYFKDDVAMTSLTESVDDDVLARFHELVARVMRRIPPERVDRFRMYWLPDDVRFVLRNAYREASARPTRIRVVSFDSEQGLVQLRYRFTGELPVETFSGDGELLSPVYAKVRALRFFRRNVARERIVWLPVRRSIRVTLDGTPAVVANDVHNVRTVISEASLVDLERKIVRDRPDYLRDLRESIARRAAVRWARFAKRWSKPHLFEAALSLAVHFAAYRRRYQNAWVLMDRDISAGDNAEHLYRYLRTHQPQVNAWFVLDRKSPDWTRLKKEGFRLVPYRSLRWHALLCHAVHFASSNVDHYVVEPHERRRFGEPRWRFTFLQHGVTKDDISRWLNVKPIDLFVTATESERDSIAGDETPYIFTTREVKLTGFPRHDALIAKRRATSPKRRNLVLIMPTWRKAIAGEVIARGNIRAKNPTFRQTEFAKSYEALLNSDELREIARRQGVEVVFMPHPNMEPYIDDFRLPDHVRVARYSDHDVQQLLARACLVVTDYSSISFDAALIDVPVAYFQFDRKSFFSGSHIGRRGYFSYEDHGFGPVCSELPSLIRAIEELAEPGAVPRSPYAERIRSTFPFRNDTDNCQRVFDAMVTLDRHHRDLSRGQPKPASSG